MQSDSSSRSYTVAARCRRCSKIVLHAYNSWLKVTRTYYLPAFAASYNLIGLEPTGQSRPASDGTALTLCQIQPLSCSFCNETLGVTCSNTPDDKTRFKNRDFFRLTKLSFTEVKTGLEVEPIEEKAMLEEHRTENVVHHVDHTPRRVVSPAMNAPMPGNMASAPSSRILEPQRHASSPAQHGGHHYRPSLEESLAQLSSQLSIHSNILEEQRHHIERLDNAVQRLSQETTWCFSEIRDLKNEMKSRAQRGPQADAPDANEIDILTEQLQAVALKANEVDGLKVELNIMRRQIRRMDRHVDRHGSPAPGGLPSIESAVHDHAHPPPQHAQPTQTSSFNIATPSAGDSRTILYQTPSENRLPAPILPAAEPRPLVDHHPSNDSRTLPGFRSIDPATSSVSSWRPAGGYTPIAAGAPTSTPQPEAPAVSGWAAVNSNSAPKRAVPADGHGAAYEAPQPGSPKRQRLAPLMPRVSYGDQTSTGASSPYHPGGTAATPDSLPPVPSLANSRNPSNESQGSLPPPSNPLRFVLSTQDALSEDSWRPESQRQPAEAGRGGARGSPRRGGRGGSTGAGRGRGRKSGGPEERGTPEWERPECTGSQVPTSAYYQPGAISIQQQHHQELASRGNLIRRGGGVVGAPSERPAAPSAPGAIASADHQVPQASLYPDPHFMPITTTTDVASATPGNTPGQPAKKTRTKPVRNADGVLIRKDGRPDMRSVSSAMNLKKVHAKKEAERQSKETSVDDKDRSGTMGTPRSTSEHGNETGDSASPSRLALDGERDGQDDDDDEDSDDDNDDEDDGAETSSTQERHAANMRKIFPYGIDGGHHQARNMAQAFFPSVAEVRAPPEVKVEAVGAHGPALLPGLAGVVPSREKAGGQAAERERMIEGAAAAAAAAAGVVKEAEAKDVVMTDGA